MSHAFHFIALQDGTPVLRDGRPLPAVGEWLEQEPPIVICERGLHASYRAFDALGYAPQGVPLGVCLVEVDGVETEQADKLVCRRRRVLAWAPCDWVLRLFARECALSVLHLWEGGVPAVVREYLETGNEEIRDVAWAAAWAAARDAAWAAAWAAARDAVISDLNVTLESMLIAEMEWA